MLPCCCWLSCCCYVLLLLYTAHWRFFCYLSYTLLCVRQVALLASCWGRLACWGIGERCECVSTERAVANWIFHHFHGSFGRFRVRLNVICCIVIFHFSLSLLPLLLSLSLFLPLLLHAHAAIYVGHNIFIASTVSLTSTCCCCCFCCSVEVLSKRNLLEPPSSMPAHSAHASLKRIWMPMKLWTNGERQRRRGRWSG